MTVASEHLYLAFVYYVVNAGYVGYVLDAVELHPGRLLDYLGKIVAVTGVLNHPGQREQVITGMKPLSI